VGHGVDKRVGFVEDVGDKRNEAVELLSAVGEDFQKHRHVVVGVLSRVVARPRAEQHQPFAGGRRVAKGGSGSETLVLRIRPGQVSMPSSFAAVLPRIAILSSSLRPGVDRMWSTGTRFHGNG
jgi:hypothetical protein